MASGVTDASASGAGANPDAAAPGGSADRSPAREGQSQDEAEGDEEGCESEEPITDKLSDTIENLRREKSQMMAERKELTRKLKNARNKKQRLCRRASTLTESDLVDVLSMRRAIEARKRKGQASEAGSPKAKPKAKAKSKGAAD